MKVKCAVDGDEWTVGYVCPTHWVKLVNEHIGKEWKCSICGRDLYVRTRQEGEDEVVTEVYCPHCHFLLKPM